MLPKFKKESATNDNDILFLDVTPKSVKSLYAVPGEKKLIIKGVSCNEHKPNSDENILESSLNEVFQQAGTKTTRAVVGIGGPDVFGFLLIIKIKRKTPEKRITEKEMEDVYSKIKDISLQQAQNYRSMLFADDAPLETLDLVATAFSVDEQVVEDPVDQTGAVIQVSAFSSYADAEFYNSLQKELKSMGVNPIAVTTTLYSQSKLLSQDSKNFLLIDIGKSYTDVAVVFGKNIVQTRAFEIGGDYFTSHLIDKLGLPPKEANGRKEAYSEGTLPPESSDTVGDLLYEAGKSWRTGLIGVLESLTGIKSFPKKIYITGGTANLNVLQELLYEDGWKDSLPFSGELEITTADSDILDNYMVDDLKLLKDPRMFVTASLISIYNELEKEND